MTKHSKKKRKKSNQSTTDDNENDDDSFLESAMNDDTDGADGAAATKSMDFETFVRTTLSSMNKTMKSQQSSIDKIAQSQIVIKSDIKTIDKNVSKLTTRVGVIESSLEVLNTEMTEIKVDVSQNKSKIDSVRQAQDQQNNDIKALRDITEASNTEFERINANITGINSTLTTNKNSLKTLDDEMNDAFRRTQKLEDDMYYVYDELEKANAHINKLERFSRENNVRLLNYEETTNENVFDIVRDVLFKLDMPNAEIMKAHRTGKNIKKDGRTLPKQIIFKFLRHSDKLLAMKNQREKLKHYSYYLTDDLTSQDLKTKRSYKEVIDQAVSENKRVMFRNGKLLINGKVYSDVQSE